MSDIEHHAGCELREKLSHVCTCGAVHMDMTICSQCGGAGYVSNIGCCGNGLPSGECCGNGIEIQDPCEHCQTTGKEPAPLQPKT